MHNQSILKFKYILGNGYRLLTSPWRQKTITPSDATSIFGCSFGNEGWHHIRRTLSEYDANPKLKAADSTLAHYLNYFCPTTISYIAEIYDEKPLPLFVYPWGTFNDGKIISNKVAMASRFCGPSSSEFIEQEFYRTINLYHQIRVSEYKPMQFPNSFIEGVWLEALDGRRKFVVMQGNHRIAILAHMGIQSITVRTLPKSLKIIRESEMAKWPLVAIGKCSMRHAKNIFDIFFSKSGWHIANSLRTNISKNIS